MPSILKATYVFMAVTESGTQILSSATECTLVPVTEDFALHSKFIGIEYETHNPFAAGYFISFDCCP